MSNITIKNISNENKLYIVTFVVKCFHAFYLVQRHAHPPIQNTVILSLHMVTHSFAVAERSVCKCLLQLPLLIHSISEELSHCFNAFLAFYS